MCISRSPFASTTAAGSGSPRRIPTPCADPTRKPRTPDKDRVPLNAGVWRYHPIKHKFEVFAHGTSNPWGLDFDDWGQMFCEACVIPHVYHVIQGGRYQRQAGSHFNPYTYADIAT